MAINDVVLDGIGLNDGQIGFLLTQGFGSFTDPGGGGGLSPVLYSPFGLRLRKSLPAKGL